MQSKTAVQSPSRLDNISMFSQPKSYDEPLSPEIKSIIRRKVSSYLNCQLSLSPVPSKQISIIKKKSKPLPKEFPEHTSIQQFLRDQKIIDHLYKQKIDRSLDECLYFYLRCLCLAIDYQCQISDKQIDKEGSVMIEAFLFVTSSLQEVGAQKAAFYLASIAITFCQLYKILHPIGEFLLILAKISRKFFRYRQSLVLLKKALQYNWWKDKTRSQELQASFLKWLQQNSPDQSDFFEQKYEIARIFNNQEGSSTYRSAKVDIQLKVYRDLFQQFLQSSKIKSQKIIYDVITKRNQPINNVVNQRTIDLELQIYNEMSYNFLQLNKKEESKLFAEKYQSGYIEYEDSKIIALSGELIFSIQRRVAGWHRMVRKNFQLLFFADIFDIVEKNKAKFRSIDQQTILEWFQVGFEACWQSFLKKELFSYEIPLPLEFRRDLPKGKKKSDGKKFIIRQRSSSHMAKNNVQVLKKNSTDKVEENLIFNYRGIGLSRLKLVDRLERFLEALRQKERFGVLKRAKTDYQ